MSYLGKERGKVRTLAEISAKDMFLKLARAWWTKSVE
jgi:hypothetical protein